MRVNEKLLKPLTETKYLTTENADRYRSIIRIFYLEYEKLNYWMYQEDVFEELKEDPYFQEYTWEQCQQDLSSLVNWGNLATIQDTKKVSTIEEFKNKKFRYQLTEYSVEIERMVVRLENLFIEGSSLEPTLLERIRIHLSEMENLSEMDDEHIHGWWEDLNNDFKRLNQNYQDYMRDLNSIKAEELMKTKEFLVFKDWLIEYLRSFVKSLQVNVSKIEKLLTNVSDDMVQMFLKRIIQYELSIPRIDVEIKEEQIRDKIRGRWESIYNWFLGKGANGSEASKVFDTTNEIIRKITRYAVRISEQSSNGANRREEYARLAHMFFQCDSIESAHRLSASVFGVEKPLHLKGEIRRDTESINSGVYDEKAKEFIVMPRVRNYREKSQRAGIVERTAEKRKMREKNLRELEAQQKLLRSYVKESRLEFASLPVIEPYVRDVFLMWLSKALECKDKRAKTEDGRNFYIEQSSGEDACVIQCTDGKFQMPNYVIIFEEE
ncbi:MAG: TIGR02677 family protein [Anaerostipes sp.]|nr:TIGR02677 family protein [Anaerostipes sp.]